MKNIDRRDFIQKTGLSAAGLYISNTLNLSAQTRPLTASDYMGDFAAPKLKTVRIALIGVGARGSGHAAQLSQIDGTEIVAISDLYEDLVMASKLKCETFGKGVRHQHIKTYFGTDHQWKTMLQRGAPRCGLYSNRLEESCPNGYRGHETRVPMLLLRCPWL